MFFTGFADEASHDFRKQIEATKALGWTHIESRAIGSKNLASITDAEFEEIEQLLAESGVTINCYGSAVANWLRDPRKEEDFQASKTELLAAIPRMRKLGIKLVRGMSFRMAEGEQFDSPELEKIIFRKVRELTSICADNGIVYGHENCMNYAGQSYQHTLKLLEAVNSPAFTLIFDTGNPTFTFRRIGQPPYPIQSSWEFYRRVRAHISYVHIKDAVSEILPDQTISKTFTYAGDGCGDIRAIVTDLFRNGYDGGFSMEPHVAVVYHEADNPEDGEIQTRRRMETYIEYGRRFEKLCAECKALAGR